MKCSKKINILFYNIYFPNYGTFCYTLEMFQATTEADH